MRKPRVLDDAQSELDEAAAYHEEERPGYGRLFVDEFVKKALLAARFPQAGSRLAHMPEGYDIRRFIMDRFSYKLVVVYEPTEIVVIAVSHERRRPGYWHKRLLKVRP